MTTIPPTAATPFLLPDDDDVTLAIAPGPDAAGNPTTAPFDAGSVTAVFDETTSASAVVSADQTSVLVTALGPLDADDVLTISGTVGGVALTVAFPISVSAGPPTSIVVTPGALATNA
jgi:hypothetical protein